jgi:hypothetical protein
MNDWAKWLEISGAGLDLLGIAVGAWYTASKWSEHVKRDADEQIVASLEPLRKVHIHDSSLGMGLNASLGIPQLKEESDPETGAEELLVERMSPHVDPFLDFIFKWGQRVSKKLKPLGWFRFILLAPFGLVFFALLLLLEALLLPLMIVGFFIDVDKDYRLRIIVLAFMLGTILEIIKAFIH